MEEYGQILSKNSPPGVEDFFCTYNVGAKPFLKWAGGKGQLIEQFQRFYPDQLRFNAIKAYYEPFLGSGAVFFDIVQHYTIHKAYLYDINEDLVIAYKVIQKDPSMLLEILYEFQKNYTDLHKDGQQIYYYKQRSDFNNNRFRINLNTPSDEWVSRTAQLIFLNKTCFNGLYRVNRQGEFNVPIGDYNNPVICDEQNIIAVHQVLQIAEIKKADFSSILDDLEENSFVYFDPPYRPISKTSSFKAYNTHEFNDKEQLRLSQLFKNLDKKEILLMLSNSDPKNTNPEDNFFDDVYNEYNIYRIPARRMINSNASKRGKINEIIVTNYHTYNETRRKK